MHGKIVSVTEFDFHTDLQQKYLNDRPEKVFDYADSDDELSAPRPYVCDFSSETDGKICKDKCSYVSEKSDDETFSNPTVFEGLKENKLELYNFRLGERFYWRAGISRDSIKNSPIHEVKITTDRLRNLKIDGVVNVRDVGGYGSSLVSGGRIIEGRYFRGGRVSDISEIGIKQLKDLGIKVEIDMLEAGISSGPVIDGIEFYNFPIDSFTEPVRFEEYEEEYRKVFELIKNADKKPVYLHCFLGSDRTGIMTFALLSLCGVSYDDMLLDYLFTNFSPSGKRDPDREFNSWYFEKLDRYDGDSKAEKAKKWLMTKGIEESTLERIRKIFIKREPCR